MIDFLSTPSKNNFKSTDSKKTLKKLFKFCLIRKNFSVL